MEIYKRFGNVESEYIAIKKRSFAIVIDIETSDREFIPIGYFKDHFYISKKLYRCQITHDRYKKITFLIKEKNKILFNFSETTISKRIFNNIKNNNIIIFFNSKEKELISFRVIETNINRHLFKIIANKYNNIKYILNREKKIQERKLPINGKSNN